MIVEFNFIRTVIKHKFRVKPAKKQREREKRTDGPEESCPAYSGEP